MAEVEGFCSGNNFFVDIGKNLNCLKDTPPSTNWSKLLANGIAEATGTGILVLIGCASCIPGLHESPPSLIQIAFTFGCSVMIGCNSVAHISGGHINPIITLAACMLGNMKYWIGFIYMIFQVIGGVIAMVILKLLTPYKMFSTAEGTCVNRPMKDITTLEALFAEFLISFILILLVCSVWDPRHKNDTGVISIKFALAIAGLAIAGAPYSSASMNPARSFGPALINNQWDSHWIYWVAPYAGSFFATLIYRALWFYHEPEEGAA